MVQTGEQQTRYCGRPMWSSTRLEQGAGLDRTLHSVAAFLCRQGQDLLHLSRRERGRHSPTCRDERYSLHNSHLSPTDHRSSDGKRLTHPDTLTTGTPRSAERGGQHPSGLAALIVALDAMRLVVGELSLGFVLQLPGAQGLCRDIDDDPLHADRPGGFHDGRGDDA